MPYTSSEEYLAQLCEWAFLSMWSYPHAYRDQGIAATGVGKELCDLLVVFGEHVLIFSDKRVSYPCCQDPVDNWGRWYREAVLSSSRQVLGAERWLVNFPSRVYSDPKCKIPLPVTLPDSPRIHRVLVCNGAADACRLGIGGSGSLVITNAAMDECIETPFHVGFYGRTGRPFHVLDEVTLNQVLQTLDTVMDFCTYLDKREAFFRMYPRVMAAGEEELLGLYLQNVSEDGQGHDFGIKEAADGVVIEAGYWEAWLSSEARARKLAADGISYSWDALIEKFSHHLREGTTHFPMEASLTDSEILVRWMAMEGRFHRRILAECLIEAVESTQQGQVRRRSILPKLEGSPAWTFLAFPRPAGMPYEQYRVIRQSMIRAQCLVLKHMHPAVRHIVGIAVDTDLSEMSEDIVYLDTENWGEEQEKEAIELQTKLRIFVNHTTSHLHRDEYPVS
jgi:hypothetical protein